jgi:tRNA uridine 5-carboxymethylaminomethyl modification enzyme
LLRKTSINPSQDIKTRLTEAGIEPIRNATSFYELLRRPDVSYEKLQAAFGLPELADEVRQQVEISITYEGYIQKQQEQVERMEKLEEKLLPEDIDYQQVPSLRDEGREKLEKIRPRSVGQASRISGVSPADVSVLLVWLEQQRRMKEN